MLKNFNDILVEQDVPIIVAKQTNTSIDPIGDSIMTSSPICGFFSMIFQSRDVAHIQHLATKSYAQHKALQSYYENIIDLIDDLIETYQGLYGLITIKIPASTYQEPNEFFHHLYKMVVDAKKLFKDPAIHNVIDDITTLISKTLYKLNNLQ